MKDDTQPPDDLVDFLKERRRYYEIDRVIARDLAIEMAKARDAVGDELWELVDSYARSIVEYCSNHCNRWWIYLVHGLPSRRGGCNPHGFWARTRPSGAKLDSVAVRAKDLIRSIDTILGRRASFGFSEGQQFIRSSFIRSSKSAASSGRLTLGKQEREPIRLTEGQVDRNRPLVGHPCSVPGSSDGLKDRDARVLRYTGEQDVEEGWRDRGTVFTDRDLSAQLKSTAQAGQWSNLVKRVWIFKKRNGKEVGRRCQPGGDASV